MRERRAASMPGQASGKKSMPSPRRSGHACVCGWWLAWWSICRYWCLRRSPAALADLHTLLLKTELHMHVQTHTQDCPKQFDGVSCGVFVCCFADCLSGDACLLRCAFSSLRHKFWESKLFWTENSLLSLWPPFSCLISFLRSPGAHSFKQEDIRDIRSEVHRLMSSCNMWGACDMGLAKLPPTQAGKRLDWDELRSCSKSCNCSKICSSSWTNEVE
jgi:hypothetical protein